MTKKDKDKGKGNKFNKVILFSIALFMLIALALGSYGALNCGFISPAANGVIGQGTSATTGGRINISFATSAGENPDSINISLFATSPSTANSSKSTGTLGNYSNSSAVSGVTFAGAIDSMNITINESKDIIEDSNDYTLDCSCVATGGLSANCNATRTGITFDRFIGSAPRSLSPTNSISNATINQQFNAVVDGGNTTSCTLTFVGLNPGYSVYPMTNTGEQCSVTINNMPRGIYKWSTTSSDGTNTSTASVQNTLTISKSNNQNAIRAIAIAQNAGQAPTKEGIGNALGIVTSHEEQGNAGNALVRVQEKLQDPQTRNTAVGVGTGALIGGAIGASGFALGPLGVITTPIGVIVGGAVGGFIGHWITPSQPNNP